MDFMDGSGPRTAVKSDYPLKRWRLSWRGGWGLAGTGRGQVGPHTSRRARNANSQSGDIVIG